jgi:putative ABC transport system permease protein
VFGRIVWKMLRGGKGRIFVALLAVTSGAAVISALLNVQFDMQHKLTEEFSSLGPNLVIAAKSGTPTTSSTAPTLMDENVVEGVVERIGGGFGSSGIRGWVPYLYIVARLNDATPVVVAGTELDFVGSLNPTWKLEGPPWQSRPAVLSHPPGACFVGRNVALQMGLAPGQSFRLDYVGRQATFTVAEILDTGGPEDNQILANLATVQDLATLKGQIEFVQIRAYGAPSLLETEAAALAVALPEYSVRPIRAVTEAEGNLLHRTRLLIASMVALILVLTALCVLATMAALAMERREDVGLMKALGGSITRIVSLFLAEVSVLGAAGGLLGCVIGIVLAQWMGQRVFDTSITPRWEIFPLTIAMMVVVALAGALPLRLLGKVKPAVILRGE